VMLFLANLMLAHLALSYWVPVSSNITASVLHGLNESNCSSSIETDTQTACNRPSTGSGILSSAHARE